MSEQSAQADAAGSEGEALAQKFLDGVGAQPPAGGQAQAQDESKNPPKDGNNQPLSGEQLVDYGDGVLRRVPIQELVEAHKARSTTAATEASLKKLIEQGGLAYRLSEQIDNLSPARRQKLMELLSEESGDEGSADHRSDDRFVDDLLGQLDGDTRGADPAMLTRLDKLTHAVTALLKDKAEQEQRDQRESVISRVNKKLDSFDAVKRLKSIQNGSAGIDLARQSIIFDLASNPDANLDDVVAKHAAKLNGFVEALTRGAVEEVMPEPTGERRFSIPGPAPTAKELSGDALLSGQLGKNLRERFFRVPR